MDKLYLDHVSYVYSAGTPYEQAALDDVSVGIREGCITGIIGHTGSGKSTMMQMLNGLIKPKAGRVLLDGYDINSTVDEVYDAWSEREEYAALPPRKRKKKMQAEIRERKSKLCFRVGLVMQYPEYQLFEETVYADIAFGPRNMGLDEEEIRARVLEAAAFCDIGEARHQCRYGYDCRWLKYILLSFFRNRGLIQRFYIRQIKVLQDIRYEGSCLCRLN